MDAFFLGFDYSTQKLKSLIFDGLGNMIMEEFIDYDVDLPHYRTVNGVYARDNGVVLAPTSMWIEATDILFERLSNKFDLSKIVALSGSAQQHTSIFWASGASELLSSFDKNKLLIHQMKDAFSKPLSPTWMDCSTEKECRVLENLFGGKHAFQSRVGSSLANRFSGPQILKAFEEDQSLENRTEAITLVSNGMCSVFAGKIVGLDLSDAAGTGLQKCSSNCWDTDICLAISPNLEKKLGAIIHSNTIVGFISDYFVKRYGMIPSCQVVVFTGDNPSSVVGMHLKENDLCLSMGTSDTLFSCFSEQPFTPSNIPLFAFPHPLYPSTVVTLLCYKNGARVRQNVCQKYCNGDWDQFSDFLEKTDAGNDGILGLFYDDEEITPVAMIGRRFFNTATGKNVMESDISPPSVVRALIEGQLLAKYSHLAAITSSCYAGDVPPVSKLLVTGGASANKAILQVVSDIFGVSVYSVDLVNSASLGSVIRAVTATQSDQVSSEFTQKVTTLRHFCGPKNHEVYKSFTKQLFDLFQF